MKIKKPKLRELREAVKALIKGPYTSRFPYQPHQPYERFRGKPQFHADDCVGCSACFQVCPSKAIGMEDVDGKRVLTVYWDMCIFCGQCQANCLTGKGIMLSREFDLATTGKRQELRQQIEKDLVLCQSCGNAVAPYDQILWVAKKIGPLIFTNASLMLFYLEHSASVRKEGSLRGETTEKLELARPDRVSILCPRCRREVILRS